MVGYSLEQAETDIAQLRGQLTIMNEAHTLNDVTDPPNNPATGLMTYSKKGALKYAGSDGNDYGTGALVQYTTLDHDITLTSPVLPAELAAARVSAGAYRIHGVFYFQQGGAAFSQSVGWNNPAVSQARLFFEFLLEGSGASNGIGHNGLGTIPSPPFAALTGYQMWFDGICVFTAAGAFQPVFFEGTSGHIFTILSGSFMVIEPVT